MSLPSIFDYLPEEAETIIKIAEEVCRPTTERVPLNKDTLLAGLQGAGLIAAGTGLGYGAGKLLGYGADALSKKLTGKALPTQYFPPALAALGALASAAEATQMKRYKELLRNAYEDGTARRAARK